MDVTLSLDTVNRLVVMAMRLDQLHVEGIDAEDRLAIKTAEAALADAKRVAGGT